MTQFLGKYRGKVVQNLDPYQKGRVQVEVPDVLGVSTLSWAMPCVPYAGQSCGIYAVPPPGANVWVEFEGGSADRPIWTGCFWDDGETPPLALVPPLPLAHILLQTVAQNLIHISDGPTGGITMQTTTGAMILINASGITISNGRGAVITLAGNTTDINGGGLTVT